MVDSTINQTMIELASNKSPMTTHRKHTRKWNRTKRLTTIPRYCGRLCLMPKLALLEVERSEIDGRWPVIGWEEHTPGSWKGGPLRGQERAKVWVDWYIWIPLFIHINIFCICISLGCPTISTKIWLIWFIFVCKLQVQASSLHSLVSIPHYACE